MKKGSFETLIGWKFGKTTYVPLWDRGSVAMDSAHSTSLCTPKCTLGETTEKWRHRTQKMSYKKLFSYTSDSSVWLVIAHRKYLLSNSFSYTSDSSAWRRFCRPLGIIKFYVKVVSFGQRKTEGSLVVEVKGKN
jgi:hypothetical protein